MQREQRRHHGEGGADENRSRVADPGAGVGERDRRDGRGECREADGVEVNLSGEVDGRAADQNLEHRRQRGGAKPEDHDRQKSFTQRESHWTFLSAEAGSS